MKEFYLINVQQLGNYFQSLFRVPDPEICLNFCQHKEKVEKASEHCPKPPVPLRLLVSEQQL